VVENPTDARNKQLGGVQRITPIEKAARALAQLSDAEWLQIKCDEDRRRSDQRTIRDLSRELRDRKESTRD
jgi:hypothetical protein